MIQQQRQSTHSHTLLTRRAFRCLLIRFDNAKKHGRFPIRTYEAYGCQFPEGEVVVNTNALPRKGYESMTDLTETLAHWGQFEIIDEGTVEV